MAVGDNPSFKKRFFSLFSRKHRKKVKNSTGFHKVGCSSSENINLSDFRYITTSNNYKGYSLSIKSRSRYHYFHILDQNLCKAMPISIVFGVVKCSTPSEHKFSRLGSLAYEETCKGDCLWWKPCSRKAIFPIFLPR